MDYTVSEVQEFIRNAKEGTYSGIVIGPDGLNEGTDRNTELMLLSSLGNIGFKDVTRALVDLLLQVGDNVFPKIPVLYIPKDDQVEGLEQLKNATGIIVASLDGKFQKDIPNTSVIRLDSKGLLDVLRTIIWFRAAVSRNLLERS